MRLLLFFISILFSAIFYIFHNLSLGFNFFGNEIYNQVNLNSLSGNLLIESFLFFLIAMFFVFYFTPLNGEKSLLVNKKRIAYFLFYTLFFSIIYFGNLLISKKILGVILIFIFGDICFNLLSNLSLFKKQKINLRYFGLILNYLSIIFGSIIFYFYGFSIYIFLILIFNIFFNYYIHKDYTNYISLLFSIFISCFLLYFLFLKLYNFYIIFS